MFTDKTAEKIVFRLEENGFLAYFVGGCVRDSLMGRTIHDIDIASSALPQDTINIFGAENVIPTGIKHGTVTVMADRAYYEVTTFRRDGEYLDHRRPESVEFVSDIADDLSRRDFTMNAIAMGSDGTLIDPFGGCTDIKSGTIRCVGDPEKRFSEDALRILRAVRFASQLGFEIEEQTACAMSKMKTALNSISGERIREELDKLLCGEYCVQAMLKYRDIMGQIIPELRECFDFSQHSHYHKYDVYEHIVRAVNAAPQDNVILRRTMLLHDIGKPKMFRLDENGEGHFKGHAQVGAEMAEQIMERLHYDKKTISLTCTLIERHSDKIGSEKHIRRLASKIGSDAFFLLMEVKKADNLAKNEFVLAENAEFDGYAHRLRELIAEDSCMSLRQLAINGSDLTALGFEGRQVGETLSALLGLVIDGKLPNERHALLARAAQEVEE